MKLRNRFRLKLDARRISEDRRWCLAMLGNLMDSLSDSDLCVITGLELSCILEMRRAYRRLELSGNA